MFTPQALQFLFENRMNDSKEWFEAHRADYQALLVDPFRALVETLAPTMLRIDPEFVVEPKIPSTISRIYRDVRFSKDKTRYRDSMWIWFRRNKKLYENHPSYFFEITPGLVRWGCGWYMADAAAMESYRGMILSADPAFLAAKRAFERQSVFQMSDDDVYKRSKFPEQPEDLRAWLDRKSIYIVHNAETPDVIYQPGLSERLAADFRSIEAFYRFLLTACQRRQTPERIRPWQEPIP